MSHLLPEPEDPALPNKRAVAALALAVAGLLCFPVVLSLVALVLALMARAQIDRAPRLYTNRKMATVAIWLSVIGVATGVPQVWHWFR